MVEILDAGASVGHAGVEKLETRLGARLPDEYREFVLRQDGGQPEPDCIEIADETTTLRSFFELRDSDPGCSMEWVLGEFDDLVTGRRLLPIACDPGSILFCLNLDDGKVFGIDYTDPDMVAHLVADSFNHLLSSLRAREDSDSETEML